MSFLVDVLPDKTRKTLYAVYALVGVVLGAWAIADPATGWVETALAVYAFVGTAFGFTASANTPNRDGGERAGGL